MMTKECCICAGCNKPINDQDDGIIIQGNIYIADPHQRGGIIGNSKWLEKLENGALMVGDIPTEAYCKSCFMRAIPWEFADEHILKP